MHMWGGCMCLDVSREKEQQAPEAGQRGPKGQTSPTFGLRGDQIPVNCVQAEEGSQEPRKELEHGGVGGGVGDEEQSVGGYRDS